MECMRNKGKESSEKQMGAPELSDNESSNKAKSKGLVGPATVKVNIDFIKKVQAQGCTLLISELER